MNQEFNIRDIFLIFDGKNRWFIPECLIFQDIILIILDFTVVKIQINHMQSHFMGQPHMII